MILRCTLTYFFLPCLVFFSIVQVTFSQGYGSIILDTNQPPLIVSKYINGGFIEQIYDAINGPYGFGAQELYNRGFDIGAVKDETSRHWLAFKSSPNIGKLFLDTTGYNKRGKYSQHIIHAQNIGRIGVAQNVYCEKNVPMDFYVYARSTDDRPALLSVAFLRTDSTILLDTILGTTSTSWKKFSMQLPSGKGFPKSIVCIGLASEGAIEIDEASFMAADNFHGIRRAQFELYKAWHPTILRFPGGGVVDLEPARWEHGVGDIDQRTSPNFDWLGDYYRFEIGTDEFVAFCKAVGAEPQFTVGYGTGTPRDAANWLAYCNSPIGNEYSNLRLRNGSSEPFNVHFWEIGNEQYGPWEYGHSSAAEYAKRYLDYAQEMREIDPTISLLINGDTWGFNWNDTIIGIAGKEIDFLSVHWLSINSDTTNNRDLTRKAMMSNGNLATFWSPILHSRAVKSGLNQNVALAYTECVQIYADPHNYLIPIAGSLESGLWTSITLNSMYKMADIVKLVNKTMFLGSVRGGIHSLSGERVIYGGPSIYAQTMMRNWMRDSLQSSIVTCPQYSFDGRDNIPWLDAVVTVGNDTMAVSVVNAHSTDSMTIHLSLPAPWGSMGEFVVLTAPSDTSMNTPENPTAITPRYYSTVLDSVVVFPAHSHTIFKFPVYHSPKPVDTIAITDNNLLTAPKDNPVFNILLYPTNATHGILNLYDLDGKTIESRTIVLPLQSRNYIVELSNPAMGLVNCYLRIGDKEYRKTLLITP